MSISLYVTSHVLPDLLFHNCHTPMERYPLGERKKDNEKSTPILFIFSHHILPEFLFSSCCCDDQGMCYHRPLFHVCIMFLHSHSLKLVLPFLPYCNLLPRPINNELFCWAVGILLGPFSWSCRRLESTIKKGSVQAGQPTLGDWE